MLVICIFRFAPSLSISLSSFSYWTLAMNATHNKYITNRTRIEISLNAKRKKKLEIHCATCRTLFIRTNNYYISQPHRRRTTNMYIYIERENERSRGKEEKIVYLRIKSRRCRCVNDSPLHIHSTPTNARTHTHYCCVCSRIATLYASNVRAYAQHVFIFVQI